MLRTIGNFFIALDLLAARAWRAWQYRRQLNYSWHLAWHKAGWQTCD